MVKALKATGKPVVYVLCTGSALALNWEDANIDAILNAWYGGQEAGTAVADILLATTIRQVACQSHSINRSTSCRTLKITA